MYFQVLC